MHLAFFSSNILFILPTTLFYFGVPLYYKVTSNVLCFAELQELCVPILQSIIGPQILNTSSNMIFHLRFSLLEDGETL